MAVIRPIREPQPEPVGMHTHAMDNLQYIRQTMERAGSFTAVPGAGGMAMGATALVAGWIANGPGWGRAIGARSVVVWLVEALVAMAIGVGAAAIKSRQAGQPLWNGPGRKFLAGFLPPLLVGGVLTLALVWGGHFALVPGVWMLLYGAAVLSGGASSVRAVPAMGMGFLAVGTVALFGPAAWGNALLAAGFGGLHLIFGFVIAVKYGG